ncbi:MAG: hypothetical protein ACREEY_07820 [Brevundimonas sp.]
MKISRLAALVVLSMAALSGTASAQQWPGLGPVEQGYVSYHYNQEAEPRILVAVSGLNCDGSFYHDPLILGAHVETFEFDC